jgi:hypothetical protein
MGTQLNTQVIEGWADKIFSSGYSRMGLLNCFYGNHSKSILTNVHPNHIQETPVYK